MITSFLLYVVRSLRSLFLSSVDQDFLFFLLLIKVSSFPFFVGIAFIVCLCIIIILASLVVLIFRVWPDIVFSFAYVHSYHYTQYSLPCTFISLYTNYCTKKWCCNVHLCYGVGFFEVDEVVCVCTMLFSGFKLHLQTYIPPTKFRFQCRLRIGGGSFIVSCSELKLESKREIIKYQVV